VSPSAWRAAWGRGAVGRGRSAAHCAWGEHCAKARCSSIAGRPNVGKSSSSTRCSAPSVPSWTEIPGTTRDAIEAYAVIEGFPFRLWMTAGLRQADERIERLGIEVKQEVLVRPLICVVCEKTMIPPRRFSRASAHRWLWWRTKSDRRSQDPPAGLSVWPSPERAAELRRRLAEMGSGVSRARQRRACRHTRAAPQCTQRALAELEAFWQARAAGRGGRGRGDALRSGCGRPDDLSCGYARGCARPRVATFCVGK